MGDETIDDPPDYVVELCTTLELPVPDDDAEELEPEQCITEIRGRIRNAQAQSSEEVGYVEAYLVKMHRLVDDPAQALDDCINADVGHLCTQIFTRHAGVLKPSVARIYDARGDSDMFLDSMLYIEKIEVAVQHRGRKVGLMAMDALLSFVRPSVTLAFCKPAPLEFHDPRDTATRNSKYFDPARARVPRGRSLAKLQRYWTLAGFKRLGRGPFYVVNLSFRR